MCRIESPALQQTESRNVKEILAQSEEALINALQRHVQQAINRRGGNGSSFSYSLEVREKIRLKMRAIAETNREA